MRFCNYCHFCVMEPRLQCTRGRLQRLRCPSQPPASPADRGRSARGTHPACEFRPLCRSGKHNVWPSIHWTGRAGCGLAVRGSGDLPSKGRPAALLKLFNGHYSMYTKLFCLWHNWYQNENPMWLIAGAWEERQTPKDKPTPASLSRSPSSYGPWQNQERNGCRRRGMRSLRPRVQEREHRTLLPVPRLCKDLRRLMHTLVLTDGNYVL